MNHKYRRKNTEKYGIKIKECKRREIEWKVIRRK
jgi:hypothetical protein